MALPEDPQEGEARWRGQPVTPGDDTLQAIVCYRFNHSLLVTDNAGDGSVKMPTTVE